MDIAHILARMVSPKTQAPGEDPPDLKNIIKDIYNNGTLSSYPDGSRYIDDLVCMAYYKTSHDPWLVTYSASLIKRQLTAEKFYFDSGTLTALHKHNFIELTYVAEGQMCQRVSGRDEIFKQGEICLIDRDSIHAEYFYRENSVFVFLGIANSFFDNLIHINAADSTASGQNSTGSFLHDIVIKQKEKYRFVRFTPKVKNPQTRRLIEQIILELARRQIGSSHIVIGLIERLLSLLPVEYQFQLEKRKDVDRRRWLFDEVQLYMQQHYHNISMKHLISLFDHTTDYFNRLIKHYTGLTYSKFLQNMRLERAEYLLKTTNDRVEDVARQVGYENLGYFYRIFYEKYHATPRFMRENAETVSLKKSK
jgi:AraC-like DNA-binding protein/quercetin dioxygenase-like cupin family protein